VDDQEEGQQVDKLIDCLDFQNAVQCTLGMLKHYQSETKELGLNISHVRKLPLFCIAKTKLSDLCPFLSADLPICSSRQSPELMHVSYGWIPISLRRGVRT
jgi:hypothetical protein